MDFASTLPDLRGRETDLRTAISAEAVRVLRIDPAAFDLRRPFDEYGLDSIDAVVVVGRVSERLGVDLPPELLFIYSSAEAVIEALTQGEDVTPRSPQAPAFWFPGGGILDGPIDADVRAALAPDLAFEVIRVGSWREWWRDNLGIAELATRALEQTSGSAPGRPLLLVGYSQGGQLAYATALAAVAQGHPAVHLILIDSAPLHAAHRWRRRISQFAYAIGRTGFAAARSRFSGTGVRNELDGLTFWTLDVLEGLMPPPTLFRGVEKLIGQRPTTARGVVIDNLMQMRVFATLWAAWRGQSRTSLAAPVTLLRSEDPGAEDLGWGPLCSNLSVVRVAGSHHSMLAVENRAGLHNVIVEAVRGQVES